MPIIVDQLETPSPLAPPQEGADGLFSQSWFPVCLSSDVAAGEMRGFDFLGGRVVVARDRSGAPKVLSAYCPHLGADLCSGQLVDETIRCAFHFWRFGLDGKCVANESGDPVPPTARLFAFPTTEKYGCILAFNGTEPLFDLPDFPRASAGGLWKIGRWEKSLPVDPWVVCCNTPDMQHIKVVHGITFDGDAPHKMVRWTPHSMRYDFKGRLRDGTAIGYEVGIFGTNIYWQDGELDGRWFGFVAPMGLPRPGSSEFYFAVVVEEDPVDPEGARQFLDAMFDFEIAVATEDLPIIERARFRPGTLTRSDRTLARFLQYLKDYPRAHPSARYIT